MVLREGRAPEETSALCPLPLPCCVLSCCLLRIPQFGFKAYEMAGKDSKNVGRLKQRRRVSGGR